MTSLTTINGGDLPTNSRTDINNNFSALNSGKIETSVIDTDNTLSANSDAKIPTQKAVGEYVRSIASPVGKSWNEYAVANSGTDSYTITVAGVSAYVDGQTFKFKADVANTGACTLNVNGLGAKSIVKNVSTDTTTGDILAGQDVVVIYDATTGKMQLVSLINTSAGTPVVNVYTSSGTWTKPAGLKYAVVELVGGSGAVTTPSSASTSSGSGAGGYCKKTYAASALSASEAYVVGAAGVNGGSASTASTFKSMTANGGAVGNAFSNYATGGTATGGDINIQGGFGNTSTTSSNGFGRGGDSMLGFGGSTQNGTVAQGTGYGSGTSAVPYSSVGANGLPGVVIITEFF